MPAEPELTDSQRLRDALAAAAPSPTRVPRVDDLRPRALRWLHRRRAARAVGLLAAVAGVVALGLPALSGLEGRRDRDAVLLGPVQPPPAPESRTAGRAPTEEAGVEVSVPFTLLEQELVSDQGTEYRGSARALSGEERAGALRGAGLPTDLAVLELTFESGGCGRSVQRLRLERDRLLVDLDLRDPGPGVTACTASEFTERVLLVPRATLPDRVLVDLPGAGREALGGGRLIALDLPTDTSDPAPARAVDVHAEVVGPAADELRVSVEQPFTSTGLAPGTVGHGITLTATGGETVGAPTLVALSAAIRPDDADGVLGVVGVCGLGWDIDGAPRTGNPCAGASYAPAVTRPGEPFSSRLLLHRLVDGQVATPGRYVLEVPLERIDDDIATSGIGLLRLTYHVRG